MIIRLRPRCSKAKASNGKVVNGVPLVACPLALPLDPFRQSSCSNNNRKRYYSGNDNVSEGRAAEEVFSSSSNVEQRTEAELEVLPFLLVEDAKIRPSPRVYWKDPKNARAYLERVGKFLGIKEGDYAAWYEVRPKDLAEFGGLKFLKASDFTLSSLIRTAFPEHQWRRTRFQHRKIKSPSASSIQETKEWILALGKKFSIDSSNFSGWYNVEFNAIVSEAQGYGHLKKFDFSRFKLFSSVFPEHNWHPWLFKGFNFTRGQFSGDIQLRFCQYLEQELNISKREEWYSITRTDFARIHLPRLFRSQSDFIEFLRNVYPLVDWEPQKMAWTSLGFSNLQSTLRKIFNAGLVPSKQFFPAEPEQSLSHLDRVLVVPSMVLLFEYQGPITYARQIMEAREILTVAPSRTLRSLIEKFAFTPITVPFWWDRKEESLLASIFSLRRDLFESDGPLAPLLASASIASKIPDSVPLSSLNISEGYIQLWSQDPRFTNNVLASKAKRRLMRRKAIQIELPLVATK